MLLLGERCVCSLEGSRRDDTMHHMRLRARKTNLRVMRGENGFARLFGKLQHFFARQQPVRASLRLLWILLRQLCAVGCFCASGKILAQRGELWNVAAALHQHFLTGYV